MTHDTGKGDHHRRVPKERGDGRGAEAALPAGPGVRASVDDTIDILRGLKDRYEGSHRVKITELVAVAAAELSDRYITDRFIPDKAIDLMDLVSSRGLPPSAVWKGFERERKPKKRGTRVGSTDAVRSDGGSGAAATVPRAARAS
jgi:hypothetical protein